MLDKFNIGKFTGNKVDPYIAAEEMRHSGNFCREEYLSGQQIASNFSRLAHQRKSDDYVAAQCGEYKENLKSKIRNILDASQ